MDIKKAISALYDLIGREKVHTEGHYLSLYSYDSTNIFFKPDAVLFPTEEEDVVNIARVSSEYKIPLVARGSGTSRSGGPLPVKGGFVVSFSRMNRIKEISRTDMLAVVEPGVITYELNLEASRYNLYYPPDPSSVKVSTIGGNIAHNAGGIKAVKYGVTKNFLLGMRAVTIEGKVLRLGGRVLKSVVGYDLMRLIAGSEGTLALITEATLRLIPKPESRSLFAVGLGDEYSWIDIVLNIYSSGILPCSIEFMDRVCLSVNQKLKEFESLSDRDIQSMLFIELDGNRDSVRRESEVIREILIKGNIKTFLFSDSPSEIERIWDIRRDVSPSLNLIGEFKIADDISIPLSNLRPLVSSLRDFAEKNNLTIAIFGHAGDSNLHINFLFKSRSAMEENYRLVMDHLSDIVIKYNGSISGEHGVGLLKREYAERELDRNAVELMKEIKRLMDPNNLLNPDKIFKGE